MASFFRCIFSVGVQSLVYHVGNVVKVERLAAWSGVLYSLEHTSEHVSTKDEARHSYTQEEWHEERHDAPEDGSKVRGKFPGGSSIDAEIRIPASSRRPATLLLAVVHIAVAVVGAYN